MTCIRAIPKSWLSWGFDLYLEDEPLLSLDVAWLREGGQFLWDGRQHDLTRETLWSGDFTLTADGQVLARATKDSAFMRRFTVRVDEREMTLEPRSWLTRSFRLVEAEAVVGSIVPDHPLSRSKIGIVWGLY